MKIQETKYTAQKNARPLREQRSTGFYGLLCVTFPAGCDGGSLRFALITKPFNSAQTIPRRDPQHPLSEGADGGWIF
jgi:hypothetical protein